jgi:putative ABC transport system permease protein
MTGHDRVAPPALADWLLRLSLGREAAEIVAGDLHEALVADADRIGRRAARRRYWRMTMASIAASWRPERPVASEAADRRRVSLAPGLVRDVQHGLRQLGHRPGFSVAVIATLALGIAATTTVFGLINALVLHPLPYADPGRVVFLLGWDTRADQMRFNMRYVDAADLSARVEPLGHVAVYRGMNATLTGAGMPERVQAYRVSPGTFGLLGVDAALGRTFDEADLDAGNDRIAVLSHGLWMSRFGGDPAIVGQSIPINGAAYVVSGVMPASFEFPVFNFKGDLWIPLVVTPEWTPAARDQSPSVVAIARLAPGTTVEAAQTAATAVMQQIAAASPDTNGGRGVRITPMGRLGTEQGGPAFAVLAVAVGLVLLVACINAANLQLARGVSRGREIALRTALGASRRRVVRQLVVESALLAVAAGAVGSAAAWLALEGLRDAMPEFVVRVLPGVDLIRLDETALFFTALVSLSTVMVFGLVPAWRSVRPVLGDALRTGGRGATDPARQRLRSSLIVGEVAVSVALLVATGLLARSAHNLSSADPGFDKDRVLAFSLSLPPSRFPTGDDRRLALDRLLDRMRALPGVSAAGVVNTLPFSTSDETVAVDIGGATGEPLRVGFRLVSDGYLDALGVRVVEGRALGRADGAADAAGVLVNRAYVDRYLADVPPIGRRIRIDDRGPMTEATIVGVVEDVQHWALSAEPTPELYADVSRDPRTAMTFAVRTDGDPVALIASVRAAAAEVEPTVAIYDVAPLRQLVDNSFIAERVAASALVVFGLSAVLLTSLGLYGLLSFVVGLRTPEIGVRVALGAPRGSVMGLVLRQSLGLVAAGLAVGLVMAALAARGLGALLFGISPQDPASFAGAAAVIGLVALLAAWLPARRALAVDPVVALRE